MINEWAAHNIMASALNASDVDDILANGCCMCQCCGKLCEKQLN